MAPVRAACSASAAASSTREQVTPITVGTRPATVSTAISASLRRSSRVWLNHSPVLPFTQIPCTPCATDLSRTALNAFSSSSPSEVNGVIAAVQ
ncbi:hypothetical protein LUX32_32505 [Actinomadura madurae]|nr:hypothetical protein [Actinomadura madurae]MCP9981831.1 hypothetical protein [Actinomadura madurae]